MLSGCLYFVAAQAVESDIAFLHLVIGFVVFLPVAERGYEIACRPSVCLSVRPSVCP